MTRFAGFALALAATAVPVWSIDVATCQEFAAVDRATEAEVTVTNAVFSCEEYTRLSIRSDMIIKSSVGPVTFSNLALKVIGSLTVEMDVEFTGVELVEKNGGALKLEFGAVGVFKGTASFHHNSIISTVLEPSETIPWADFQIQRKGGAIHNKGDLTFEKDAVFTRNLNDNVEYGSGPGGAISNQVKGTMTFMGSLNMTDNTADDDFGGAEGGAFFNRGDVVVDGEAVFKGNYGGRGGAIYQGKWGTFVFNSFATFESNRCIDTFGGGIANFGGVFDFKGGSSWVEHIADNSGDGGIGGAIYNENGGVITLEGSTEFKRNYAYWGGAIANRIFPGEFSDDYTADSYKTPTITYPDDTIFEDNGGLGNFCPDVVLDFDEDTCGL
ncbi:unnamed protein product [Ascophyllum nodosum]